MMYSDSVEEQRYLSGLRREKNAFERLIREKSVSPCPLLFCQPLMALHLEYDNTDHGSPKSSSSH